MTLSQRTDFALRTLMYLAAKKDRRVRTSDIADTFGIPVNHLVKIVNELSHRGYVRTIRGPGGGVELAKLPADITVGQVIEDMQGPIHLHECVPISGICVIESFCKLRGIFREADQLQREFLNRFSLADITPKLPEP